MSMSSGAWPVTRSAAAGLCYHVLAHLDLAEDAADLHDPSLPPAAWVDSLARAYARAPGRLALQHVGLTATSLAELRAWLAAPPPALADEPGRALANCFAAALEQAAPAFLAAFAADDARAAARAEAVGEALAEPLARLRAGLWERHGGPPPLRLLDVPALRDAGRGAAVAGVSVVAVDLRRPPAHVLCQALHEEIHLVTDPVVARPGLRDTRAGSDGFASHAALEHAAVVVGEALIAARAPAWSPAYRAWCARWGALPVPRDATSAVNTARKG